MKVRIFALAKELGLDSKELIQRCSEVGVEVKNSALASITPEERDLVLGHLKGLGSNEPVVQTAVANVPIRESAGDMGRIREIKTLGPLGRLRRKATEDEGPSVAIEEPPEIEAPVPLPVAPDEPSGDLTQDDEAEQPDPTTEELEPAARGSDSKVRPITREDYVPPVGGTGSGLREMKPVASIQEQGVKPGRKQPKKPALPTLAPMPNFKPPSPRASKAEAPAQKPDMPLTAEFLKQSSPLASIIRKNAEDRKRGPIVEEEETEKRPSRPGALAWMTSVSNVARADIVSRRPMTNPGHRPSADAPVDVRGARARSSSSRQRPFPSRSRFVPCRKNSADRPKTSCVSCFRRARCAISTANWRKRKHSKSRWNSGWNLRFGGAVTLKKSCRPA